MILKMLMIEIDYDVYDEITDDLDDDSIKFRQNIVKIKNISNKLKSLLN